MNSIIIRIAAPDDATAISKVLLDSFNQFRHVDEVIKRMEEGLFVWP